jgi:hypothetical protein
LKFLVRIRITVELRTREPRAWSIILVERCTVNFEPRVLYLYLRVNIIGIWIEIPVDHTVFLYEGDDSKTL